MIDVPKDKFILDACCGTKQMWTNKNQKNTIYIDIRKEAKGFSEHEKNLEVNPDIVADFRQLPFPDKSFKLIVCDPPHLKQLGETSIFRKKYGCLNAETWELDLTKGFNEMWRCLEDYGILIFKWCDNQISKDEFLSCCKVKPLFYNISSWKATSKTMWFCFMKIPEKVKEA